jgi:hypothetical protein
MESLFLEIVERARAEGLETSGARSGGRVADFLRGAPGGAAAATVAEPVAAEPARAADPAPPAEVDAGLIDSLTRRS